MVYAPRVRSREIYVERVKGSAVFLHISKLQMKDSGEYECYTPNTDGKYYGNYSAKTTLIGKLIARLCSPAREARASIMTMPCIATRLYIVLFALMKEPRYPSGYFGDLSQIGISYSPKPQFIFPVNFAPETEIMCGLPKASSTANLSLIIATASDKALGDLPMLGLLMEAEH